MSTWTVDQWKDMLEWAVLMFLIAFAFVMWLLDWYREQRAAAAPDLSAEGFDAVCEAVAKSLGTPTTARAHGRPGATAP